MKSGSAPPAPNFNQLALQQQDANTNALIANRFDQVNPFGSQTWMRSQTVGADGKPTDAWQLRTNLNNEQQNLLNQGVAAQTALASRSPQYAQMVADLLANPIDNGAGVRERVEGELLGKLNMQSDRDLESIRSRLLNQGITENSEAWRRAMADFDTNRQNARTSAILSAGQEASRQVAMDSGLRGQYLNELASMLGQTGPTIPQYQMSSAMATAPDLYGAAQDQYAAQMNNYNAKLAHQGQLLGAAGSLAGSGLMAYGMRG